MKFLCDNCKAKYQIADEKVAGKTVRMKCRKCGHQIEVRSAVTESTGSIPPPAPVPGARPPAGKPLGGGLATSLSAQKPKAPSMSGAPGGALAGAFAKNVNDAPASSVSSAPSGGKGVELSVSDEWYVAINGVPVGPVRISELRRKAATGAVNEDSLCWQEGLEEWRPIKSIPELAQLVREAAAGNRPSLIDPTSSPNPGRISTFPSAPKMAAARSSTIPPAPGHPSAPMPISAPVATSPMTAPPRPMTPSAPAVAARSNVVPLRPNTSAPMPPSMDDMPMGPFGSSGAAAAFAPSPLAPQTSPLPMSSPVMPAAAPHASPDPFAPSGPMPAASPFSLTPTPGSMGPQPAATPLLGSNPSYADVGMRPSFHPSAPSFSQMPSGVNPIAPMPVPVAAPERRGGTPLWFWPILVLFLGFGGGAAYFVFVKQPPAPVVIQVPATPTTAAPAGTPSDATLAMDIPSAEPIAQNDAPTGTTKKPVTTKKPGSPASEPAPAQKGLDLGGLGTGNGGPNVGPNQVGGGGGGGGLDQAGVERVVSAHRAGVKRTCWERGGADQKSSVNVNVKATVAPNGTVQSVSSSGDDPVVGKCIESQVRTWSFPAPGSATDINIPFKFVRQ